MSDPIELTHRLRRLTRRPYGRARTAATELIVREVEANGPETLLPEALLELVEAYTFGGEAEHAFVPFARALRLWDATPELFDEADQQTLFWQFKWIAASPAAHPQISAQQAEAVIADMERRYRLAGLSTAAVEKIRMGWLWHSGRDYEAARRRWEATTNDAISDCPACDTATRVALAIDAGRYDEAVAVAHTQTHRCNREPAGTWFDLALAEMRRGRVAEALEALRDAHSAMDAEPTDPYGQWYGQEFEVLALSGRLDQALARMAASWTPQVLKGDNPRDRFELRRGLVAGLAAHRARFDEALPALPDVDPSIRMLGDLYAWAVREANQLAEMFDARNGTSRYTEQVAAAERAHVVDTTGQPKADAAEASPQAAHPDDPKIQRDAGDDRERVGAPATPSAPAAPGGRVDQPIADAADAPAREAGPSPLDPVSLWRHAESLGARHPDAADAYARAAQAAEDAGLLDDAGLAWAESAHAAGLADDPARAHRAYARGVRLLRAGDAPLTTRAAVIEAWAPVAVQAGGAREALSVVLDELTAVDTAAGATETDADTPRGRTLLVHRAHCQDAVARLAASVPEEAAMLGLTADAVIERAHDAAALFERADSLVDAVHAAWLEARLLTLQRRTQEAVMAYEGVLAAFAHLHQRTPRTVAAGEFIELLAEIGDQVAIERVVRTLTD